MTKVPVGGVSFLAPMIMSAAALAEFCEAVGSDAIVPRSPTGQDLATISEALSRESGTVLELDSEDLDQIRLAIGFAAGRFVAEREKRTVKQMKAGLSELSDALRVVERIVRGGAEGLVSDDDRRTYNQVHAQLVRLGIESESTARARLDLLPMSLSSILFASEMASAKLDEFAGLIGRSSLGWYDEFTIALASVAKRRGIKPTVTTDRVSGNKTGAFLTLVQMVEAFLPAEMRSASVSACARRIQRAIERSRATTKSSS